MTINKAIYFAAGLAIVLGLGLWLLDSSNDSIKPESDDMSDITELTPDTIEMDLSAQRQLIQDGDSLWVWNDTFMEFNFARFMSDEEIVGAPASDTDQDGKLDLTWKTLQTIHYAKEYFEDYGMEVYIPAFPDAIKKLDGQVVQVEGFTIPFDEEESFVALSASPFANCFFCGKGSPASVISLYLKDEAKQYRVDEFIKFEGTLRLNYDDPGEFYYVLDQAIPVK